jgi:hypothetical protein
MGREVPNAPSLRDHLYRVEANPDTNAPHLYQVVWWCCSVQMAQAPISTRYRDAPVQKVAY